MSHITDMQVFIQLLSSSGNIKYECWRQFINIIVIIAIAIWSKGEFIVWYKNITLVVIRFIVFSIEPVLILPSGALQLDLELSCHQYFDQVISLSIFTIN